MYIFISIINLTNLIILIFTENKLFQQFITTEQNVVFLGTLLQIIYQFRIVIKACTSCENTDAITAHRL